MMLQIETVIGTVKVDAKKYCTRHSATRMYKKGTWMFEANGELHSAYGSMFTAAAKVAESTGAKKLILCP